MGEKSEKRESIAVVRNSEADAAGGEGTANLRKKIDTQLP
jgi:hypothetical protein